MPLEHRNLAWNALNSKGGSALNIAPLMELFGPRVRGAVGLLLYTLEGLWFQLYKVGEPLENSSHCRRLVNAVVAVPVAVEKTLNRYAGWLSMPMIRP